MASTQSQALYDLYTNWGDRFAANPAMDLDAMRDLYDSWGRVTVEPENVTYKEVTANGVPSLWALPEGGVTDAAILYAHGGAYVGGSIVSHRKLAGHFARATGIPTMVYGYRLAPENSFPQSQFEDTRGAYDWIVAQGISPSRIGLIGDSAGGALVTLLALQLKDAGGAMPGAVVALSPMYDLEATGESLVSNKEIDLLASREATLQAAAMLLGPNGAADDPSVNPLKAELAGLPPFFLSVGGSEGLLDDSRRFAQKASAAGVEIEIEIVPEMQHVFHFLAGSAPEAIDSVKKISTFLKRNLLAS